MTLMQHQGGLGHCGRVEPIREYLDIASATQARAINDPVGACMLLMLAGMPHLASNLAAQYLNGYQPTEESAKATRRHLYALNGGKS